MAPTMKTINFELFNKQKHVHSQSSEAKHMDFHFDYDIVDCFFGNSHRAFGIISATSQIRDHTGSFLAHFFSDEQTINDILSLYVYIN